METVIPFAQIAMLIKFNDLRVSSTIDLDHLSIEVALEALLSLTRGVRTVDCLGQWTVILDTCQ